MIAEFRGPGVHHNFDDSESGYDLDNDSRSKSSGSNRSGRIILLGDGTEVLTDSDDTEMFDHDEEEKDLASQVKKGQADAKEAKSGEAPTSDNNPEKAANPGPEYKGVADGVLPKKEPTEESKTELK